VDAIRQFKAAMIQFIEDASDALVMWKIELARALEWLDSDRPAYCEQRVRDAWTALSEARVALEMSRSQTVAGQRAASREEVIGFEKAKQEVQLAEQMVETVRDWRQKLLHELDEHEGRIVQLQTYLDTDLCRALAALERILETLDAYSSVSTGESDPGRPPTDDIVRGHDDGPLPDDDSPTGGVTK
jgi:hypothetical protein